MKPFMKNCYKCNSNVRGAIIEKDGINIKCLKCPKCGEEYFTSSELVKYDILKGNKKLVRKFGSLGQSTIMRFPDKILGEHGIQPGDYGIFENRPEGILIRPLHAKELKL